MPRTRPSACSSGKAASLGLKRGRPEQLSHSSTGQEGSASLLCPRQEPHSFQRAEVPSVGGSSPLLVGCRGTGLYSLSCASHGQNSGGSGALRPISACPPAWAPGTRTVCSTARQRLHHKAAWLCKARSARSSPAHGPRRPPALTQRSSHLH